MTKKYLLAAIFAAAAFSGINSYAAEPAKATPAPAPAPKVKAPALTDENSWTMVIVPDTQTYIKQIENQGVCKIQNH